MGAPAQNSMMNRRELMKNGGRLFAGLTLAAAVPTALAACSEDDKTSDSSSSAERRTITYVTGAGMYGREAFVYVAKEKGYFDEENLDIEIVAGQGSEANLKLLVSGQADIVTADFSAAVIAYGAGLTDFKVIAAAHQLTTACLICDPTVVSSAKDLEGKNIAYIPGGVNYTLFPAYAQLAGIDQSKVVWTSVQAESLISSLIAKNVDGITQLALAATSIQAAIGQAPTVLAYNEYLSDLYGNVFAVSSTCDQDLAERMRRAMLGGLEYAMNNKEEAASIFVANQPTQKRESALAEMTLMEPYVTASTALGTIDSARVTRNISVIQGMGLVDTGITSDLLIYEGFATA